MTTHHDRLILALDFPTVDRARHFTDTLGELGQFYKIGLELLPSGGPDLARHLKHQGKSLFLDYKLHDIPRTVEAATRTIAGLGVDMLTVHAEPQVMKAAVEGKGDSSLSVLGVTVLTSLDDQALRDIGYRARVRDLVLRRVEQALEAGLDGIVASPLEVADIRARFGDNFLIITPGVRLKGQSAGDQKRYSNPGRGPQSRGKSSCGWPLCNTGNTSGRGRHSHSG